MSEKKAKLSKSQSELLEAMKKGVICHYIAYSMCSGPYYFRSDTMKRCTAAARALREKGLVQVVDNSWRDHKLKAL